MYKYNEYLKLTKQRLNNITFYEKALKNMNASLEDAEKNLQTEAIAIAKYGEFEGRAFTELTPTERAAQERMKWESELNEVSRQQRRLEYQLKMILRSVDMLDAEEKQVIQMFYFDKYNNNQIADKIGCSERTARRKVNEATKHIAIMLFGNAAEQDIEFVQYSVTP